jgi:hypothetical protein
MIQNDEETKFGFAITLVIPERVSDANPRYRGIDCSPAIPSQIPEESAALHDYVFGEYKSEDSNLISTIELAMDLWTRLSASPRQFEIVGWAPTEDDFRLTNLLPRDGTCVVRGYDVANISSDYWSIVHDLPRCPWTSRYLSTINNWGLFQSREAAARYLEEYRRRREADWDCAFEVGCVSGIGVPRQNQ